MSEAQSIQRNVVAVAFLSASVLLLIFSLLAQPANAQRIECDDVDVDGTVVTMCMTRSDDDADDVPADDAPADDVSADDGDGEGSAPGDEVVGRGERQDADEPDPMLFVRPGGLDEFLATVERPDKSRSVPEDGIEVDDNPANDYAEAIISGAAGGLDRNVEDEVFDSSVDARETESASGLTGRATSAMEPHLDIILFAWVGLLVAGIALFAFGRLGRGPDPVTVSVTSDGGQRTQE